MSDTNINFKMPMFDLSGMTRVGTICREVNCPYGHGSYRQEIAIMQNGDEYPTNNCPMCEKIEHERQEQKAREEEKARIEKDCKSCNIELEYYYKGLNDYKPGTKSQKDALEAVKNMIENKNGKVILLGSNGVGKTMLGSVAARELKGKIYSMYEISTMIRQSYTVRADKTELEIVTDLASIPFLAIDELGRTKGSDAELNWLSYVLDKRHTRNLPTMIMSNKHLGCNCKKGGCSDCFENFMNSDIISRFQQKTKIITIAGNDFRAEIL